MALGYGVSDIWLDVLMAGWLTVLFDKAYDFGGFWLLEVSSWTVGERKYASTPEIMLGRYIFGRAGGHGRSANKFITMGIAFRI